MNPRLSTTRCAELDVARRLERPSVRLASRSTSAREPRERAPIEHDRRRRLLRRRAARQPRALRRPPSRRSAFAAYVEHHGRVLAARPPSCRRRRAAPCPRDAPDREVGDRSLEQAGPVEGLADVLVVVPAVEDADLHELPVRAGPFRREAFLVPLLGRQRAQRVEAPLGHAAELGEHLRAASGPVAHDPLLVDLADVVADVRACHRPVGRRGSRRAASSRCRSCGRRCPGPSNPGSRSACPIALRSAVAHRADVAPDVVERADQRLGHRPGMLRTVRPQPPDKRGEIGDVSDRSQLLFDPMCPYAYQTSRWIRDVRDADAARHHLAVLLARGDQPGRGEEAPVGTALVVRLRADAVGALSGATWATTRSTAGTKPSATRSSTTACKTYDPEEHAEVIAAAGFDPALVERAIADDVDPHRRARRAPGRRPRLRGHGVPTIVFHSRVRASTDRSSSPRPRATTRSRSGTSCGHARFPHLYELRHPKTTDDLCTSPASSGPTSRPATGRRSRTPT